MAEIYLTAAKIVEKILLKKGTPKSLVIENSSIKNKKKLYALVCEAIKYKSVSDKLLEATKLLSMEKQLKYSMALVLVYDFLFGRGLQVGGQLKQVINRNKTSLQAALARMKVKAKVVNNEELLPKNVQQQQEMQIPRYVRVNTIKTSIDDVVTWFSQNGFSFAGSNKDEFDSAQMAKQSFSVDEHISNLLVFPSGTDLHNNDLYKEGKIILQDKASCFPAFVLSPPAGSLVIDACAAPGNKTSHLAAIMGNKGKIFAFDISDKRISTMKKLLERTGENIVETKHEDFLKVDPNDLAYTNAQYILVDPSCSGSGMINRLDYATCSSDNMDAEEKKRIYSLGQFQVKVLSHALSFPNVMKVVYSTCSLHNMENEEVVKSVIEKFHEKFELKMALPGWQHRGRSLFPEASRCVRASPTEGHTSGFFLALFQARNAKENFKRMEMQKEIESDEMKISFQKKNETVQAMEQINDYCKRNERRRRIKRKPSGTIIAEKLSGEKELNGEIDTNSTANATKRRRVCTTKNIAKIGQEIVEKKQTNMKYKYRRTRVKTTGINRKCSDKEFEKRMKTLIQRRRKKCSKGH
ncbi:probable 28S rRNA (cytosine-C(5))-methyltransferase [Dendronephthya gigantea]|uniref:probable 28S rRNA (cytosine-C(5))-methyltransferase n=1 Tax=Dendronephthya gigantea TaxID=151771 RepID=UPI00106A9684|nr:probable 28S rRNA (cytosine-C(5))-methyltransferase [Dendronephthya gigantea]